MVIHSKEALWTFVFKVSIIVKYIFNFFLAPPFKNNFSFHRQQNRSHILTQWVKGEPNTKHITQTYKNWPNVRQKKYKTKMIIWEYILIVGVCGRGKGVWGGVFSDREEMSVRDHATLKIPRYYHTFLRKIQLIWLLQKKESTAGMKLCQPMWQLKAFREILEKNHPERQDTVGIKIWQTMWQLWPVGVNPCKFLCYIMSQTCSSVWGYLWLCFLGEAILLGGGGYYLLHMSKVD